MFLLTGFTHFHALPLLAFSLHSLTHSLKHSLTLSSTSCHSLTEKLFNISVQLILELEPWGNSDDLNSFNDPKQSDWSCCSWHCPKFHSNDTPNNLPVVYVCDSSSVATHWGSSTIRWWCSILWQTDVISSKGICIAIRFDDVSIKVFIIVFLFF